MEDLEGHLLLPHLSVGTLRSSAPASCLLQLSIGKLLLQLATESEDIVSVGYAAVSANELIV